MYICIYVYKFIYPLWAQVVGDVKAKKEADEAWFAGQPQTPKPSTLSHDHCPNNPET